MLYFCISLLHLVPRVPCVDFCWTPAEFQMSIICVVWYLALQKLWDAMSAVVASFVQLQSSDLVFFQA